MKQQEDDDQQRSASPAYQLKHLTLKNRVMSTSYESAYSQDGMPKERCRLYHAEKAKGGMARSLRATSTPRSMTASGSVFGFETRHH
ncbi:MAG: hypothetical protein ABJB10_03810 [Mesorhizobium sp.]